MVLCSMCAVHSVSTALWLWSAILTGPFTVHPPRSALFRDDRDGKDQASRSLSEMVDCARSCFSQEDQVALRASRKQLRHFANAHMEAACLSCVYPLKEAHLHVKSAVVQLFSALCNNLSA